MWNLEELQRQIFDTYLLEIEKGQVLTDEVHIEISKKFVNHDGPNDVISIQIKCSPKPISFDLIDDNMAVESLLNWAKSWGRPDVTLQHRLQVWKYYAAIKEAILDLK